MSSWSTHGMGLLGVAALLALVGTGATNQPWLHQFEQVCVAAFGGINNPWLSQFASNLLWGSGIFTWNMLKHPFYPPLGNPTGDASSFPFMHTALTPQHFKKILEWQPRDTDVITSTFPKSGTHFITQILLQTVGDGQVNFTNVHHAGALLFEWEALARAEEKCNDSEILSILNYKEKRPTQPVVLGSHLPASVLLRPGVHKHVVMMRDPLDTLISLHNQLVKLMPPFLVPSMDNMYEGIWTKLVGGYAGYYLGWWQAHLKHPDRVLFLFYEDVVANLTQGILNVTTFLGKDVDTETLERIRYRSTVEYMKSIGDSFEPPDCFLISPSVSYAGGDMVNKGVRGRGKNLPLEFKVKVFKYLRSVLAGTTFPEERLNAYTGVA